MVVLILPEAIEGNVRHVGRSVIFGVPHGLAAPSYGGIVVGDDRYVR